MRTIIFRWNACPEENIVLTTTDEEWKVLNAFIRFAIQEDLFDSDVSVDTQEESKVRHLSAFY